MQIKEAFEVHERHLSSSKQPFCFYRRTFRTEVEAFYWIEEQYKKSENAKEKYYIVKVITKG